MSADRLEEREAPWTAKRSRNREPRDGGGDDDEEDEEEDEEEDDDCGRARKMAKTAAPVVASTPSTAAGVSPSVHLLQLGSLDVEGVRSTLVEALRGRIRQSEFETLVLRLVEEEIDGEVLVSMSADELERTLGVSPATLSLLRRLLTAPTTTTTGVPAHSPRTPAPPLALPSLRHSPRSASVASKSTGGLSEMSVTDTARFVADVVGAHDESIHHVVASRIAEEEIDGECLAAMREEEYRDVLGLNDGASLVRLAQAVAVAVGGAARDTEGVEPRPPHAGMSQAEAAARAPDVPAPVGLSHASIPARECASWLRMVVDDELGGWRDGEAVAKAALDGGVDGGVLMRLCTPEDVRDAFGGEMRVAAAEAVARRLGGLRAALLRPGGVLPHLPTRETAQSPTRVVVLGDTGAGKSTVINSLLGERKLLPTNGMRACTAAVVELSFNAEATDSRGFRVDEARAEEDERAAPLYAAEVEFLAEDEWNTELRALCAKLTDGTGVFRAARPEPDTPAYEAWWRLKSVYGRVAPLEELVDPAPASAGIAAASVAALVSSVLGSTRAFTASTGEALHAAVEPYVDSSNEAGGTALWPLVRRVRSAGPGASSPAGLCWWTRRGWRTITRRATRWCDSVSPRPTPFGSWRASFAPSTTRRPRTS